MDLRDAVALFIALTLTAIQDVQSEEPVYFSLIVSEGERGFRSSGAIPAIDIALDEIKNHGLLPGYNFTYETPRNSKVKLFLIHACIK